MKKYLGFTFPSVNGIQKTFKLDLPIIPWQSALVIKTCWDELKDDWDKRFDFIEVFNILQEYYTTWEKAGYGGIRKMEREEYAREQYHVLLNYFKLDNFQLEYPPESFFSGVEWILQHEYKAFCAYNFTYGVKDDLYRICFGDNKKNNYLPFLSRQIDNHDWLISVSATQTDKIQTEFPKELIKKQFPQIPSRMYQKVKIPDNAFDNR
ncbi:MAG: hypothetical protein M3Z86_03485 [Lactobacillus panisapium]|nr:hypothetical protein [Lactobacillus panisapium]